MWERTFKPFDLTQHPFTRSVVAIPLICWRMLHARRQSGHYGGDFGLAYKTCNLNLQMGIFTWYDFSASVL